MSLNLGGALRIASSIVIVPRCQMYSTILSVKSGLVSALSSHHSSAVVQSWNASTRPTSGHRRMCSAFSTWIVQQGHLSLHPSWCFQLRFLFVAAIFITCLHAQTWNSWGTSSFRVRCTCGQSTSSNTSVDILLSDGRRTLQSDARLHIVCAHPYRKSSSFLRLPYR